MLILLTISGFDPIGGAGLHAEIKTAKSLGLHAVSVITALTIQNTCGVYEVLNIDPEVISRQLDAILGDVNVSAVKIGMIPNLDIAKVISSCLKTLDCPKVLDPIINASSGTRLGDVEAYKLLLPYVSVITPNFSEAKILSGIDGDPKDVASKLAEFGCNVVITGGELGGKDFVYEFGKTYWVEAEFSPINIHGTGCAYSSALACYLAMGKKLEDAARFARIFTLESVKKAVRIGKCFPSVNP